MARNASKLHTSAQISLHSPTTDVHMISRTDRYPSILTFVRRGERSVHSAFSSPTSGDVPGIRTAFLSMNNDEQEGSDEVVRHFDIINSHTIRYILNIANAQHITPRLRPNNPGSLDEEGTSAVPERSRIRRSTNRIPRTRAVKYARIALSWNGNERIRDRSTKLDNTALFRNALKHAVHLFQFLKNPDYESENLRVVHTQYTRCEFALITAHVSSTQSNISSSFAGVLWQTRSYPQKAICVTISLSPSGLTFYCTCNASISFLVDGMRSCNHIQACQEDVEFIDELNFTLSLRQTVSSTTKTHRFGEPLQPLLDRHVVGKLSRDHETDEVDNMDKSSSKWSFWIVFDTHDKCFTPVLKRFMKPFQCQSCIGHPMKRGMCAHECICRSRVRRAVQDLEASTGVIHSDESSADEQLSGSELSTVDVDESHVPNVNEPAPSTSETQSTYTTNVQARSPLMCRGEAYATKLLIDDMGRGDGNELVTICELSRLSCPKCETARIPTVSTRLREVTLFTLANGSPTILVEDWRCPSCEDWIMFTGEAQAIFPATKTTAYTTELLYSWVHSVCLLGNSFRNAYMSTRILNRATTTNGPFSSPKWAVGEARRSRRSANEIFRVFLRRIDVENLQFSNTIFSCPKCEQPLTDEEKTLFNIDEQPGKGRLSRFDALVIDGTASGILGRLPPFVRPTVKIDAPHKIRKEQRLVSKVVTKKMITELCEKGRVALRDIVRHGSRSTEHSASAEKVEFHISLSGSHDEISKRFHLFRTLLDDKFCFCSIESSSVDANLHHSEECISEMARTRSRLLPENFDTITSLLKSCFAISKSTPHITAPSTSEGLVAVPSGLHDDLDPDEVDDYTNDDVGSIFEDTSKLVPITLNFPDAYNMSQLIESVLDLVRFILIDHACLPLLAPPRSYDRSATLQRHFPPPHISPKLSTADICSSPPLEDTSSPTPHSASHISKTNIMLHRQFCEDLHNFSACTHRFHDENVSPPALRASSTITEWPCVDCESKLLAATNAIGDSNPVLFRTCRELLRSNHMFSQTIRHLCSTISLCISASVTKGTKFLRSFDRHCSRASQSYWRRYGNGNLLQINDSTATDVSTGQCFPGRATFRPDIVFEGTETQHCSKKYTSSESHSPGLLTVQCGCDNPKLIGFIVMTRAESTHLALSSILTHFRVPPRTLFYDNGCNMVASALLRVPWLLQYTRIVIDRFHNTGHTCSKFFDADSYIGLNSHRSSTAESFNARISTSTHHMRFLKGDNLIPFLRIRFALLNLAAHFRSTFNRRDVEDEDLTGFLQTLYECKCYLCRCRDIHHEDDVLLSNEGENGANGDGELVGGITPAAQNAVQITTFMEDVAAMPTAQVPGAQT